MHGKTKHHSETEKQRKSQRFFTSSSHVQISNNQNVLPYDKQAICAETFEALKYVEPNLSFASSNGENHQTKMKYNIQFGITPYVKEILVKDVCKRTGF